MSQKIILETIGTIEKKELLGPVGYDELVLESFEPFPGYHGTTVPDTMKPKSLFVITRSKYIEEKIIRTTQRIKKERNLEFDGTPGHVTLYNMLNPCLRIRGLKSFELVPDILHAYEDEGIEFMANRKIEPFTGIIKVKKYFLLDPISEEVFYDAEDKNMFYFAIPIQLRFNQFEKITMEIKHTMEEHNFDVALGTIYRRNGLIDMIRVYDQKCTPERLEMIRSMFLNRITKLID
jgi:hypothetical protein